MWCVCRCGVVCRRGVGVYRCGVVFIGVVWCVVCRCGV